jgi:hypothetical protein
VSSCRQAWAELELEGEVARHTCVLASTCTHHTHATTPTRPTLPLPPCSL